MEKGELEGLKLSNVVKDENYITLLGWMPNRLGLSGNELLTYSLIYGFSQVQGQAYTGSINYLCSWLNCSRPTAIKTLKSLTEKNLLIKDTWEVNGVKFSKYHINNDVFTPSKEPIRVVKNFNQGSKETLLGGSKETLPNIYNIDNNNIYNIYSSIVEYLNEKANTKYKRTSKKTISLIDARTKEGFTEEDFKKVIDIKTKEWLNTDMEKFLRPETLFGTKFEGYLNQREVKNYGEFRKNKPNNNEFEGFKPQESKYKGISREGNEEPGSWGDELY